MENTWYGRYDFEQTQKIREAAENNPSVKADVLEVTGVDHDLTNLILSGPDQKHIDYLRSAEPDDPVFSHFDSVWGAGAAEHYKTNFTVGEHLAEVPGAVARGGAGALAELGETVWNTYLDAVDQGADALALGVGSLFGHEDVVEEASERFKTGAAGNEELAGLQVELDADSILRGVIDKPETLTGNIVEGMSQFVAPFFTGLGAVSKLKVLATTGLKGKLAAGTIAGFVTDYAAFDDKAPLISKGIADYFEIDSQIVEDYLTHDDDDGQYEMRFRRAVEGAAFGLALDGIMIGVGAIYRKVRKGEVTPEQANAEIEKMLDEAETEKLVAEPKPKPEATPVPTQGTPEGGSMPLWHFEGNKVVRGSDTPAPKPEPGPEIESFPPKFNETIRAVEGPDVTIPKVSAAAHERALSRAKLLYEKARQIDVSNAWEEATAWLKRNVKNLDEANVRTKGELGQAILKPYEDVMKMVDTGDIKNLVKFASEPQTILEFRLRSAAIQVANRFVRETTDRLGTLYDASITNPKLTHHDKAVLRETYHKQVQFALELDALNSNIGSASGALLGQRAGHMNPVEEMLEAAKAAKEAAEAAGKSADEARKAAAAVVKKTENELLTKVKSEDPSQGSALAQKYRELTKMGVDPRAAYDRVAQMAKEARANNVQLRQKARQSTKEKRAAEETGFDKLIRAQEQWRYNAMLSGLRTHETNMLSLLAQTTSRLAYEGIFGNKAVRIAAARKVAGMVQGLKESAVYAIQAYRQMKPVLDDLSTFDRLDPVYRNHILTYPTRLMLGGDEFFKQLTYRGEVHASAMADADLAKLTGQARDNFVKDRMTKAFDPDNGAGMDMLAIDRAQSNAFQKQFDLQSKYAGERFMGQATKVLTSHWTGRLMFPFMRIFFRLTDEGIRLTPGLREGVALGAKIVNRSQGYKGGSRYYDDLMGLNGKPNQAKAFGEFAVGMSLAGWTVAKLVDGEITGGEPHNYVDAQMRRKEVPPYHIKIGDEWYDYSRFEPFSFPLKFFANTGIKLRELDADKARGDVDDDSIMASLGVFGFAVGQAVSNNSFMEGMESLIKLSGGGFDPGDQWKRFGHTMADSYVPNILRKVNDALDDSGVKYSADPLTWGAFKRHFSSVMDMSDVDVRRNPFTGEPYQFNEVDDWQGFTSFTGEELPEDKAMRLLIAANENSGAQFTLKRPKGFIEGVDLTQVKADDGKRSLYDQYLDTFAKVEDANGLTYRDHLERLYDDPVFNAMVWGNKTYVKGTKVEAIQKIKADFEKLALTQLKTTSRGFAALFASQVHRERTQYNREVESISEVPEALDFFRE